LTLREAQCRMHTNIGAQCDGGFAEYIKMPAANLIKIPQEVPFEAATMIPVNIGCSWHLLAKRAGLKPLEDVLVVGAGGAWAFTSFNWPSLWGLAGRSGSMCLRR
jgi:NADPH:quinone reductase-like Zn-dependent oxidoreductase